MHSYICRWLGTKTESAVCGEILQLNPRLFAQRSLAPCSCDVFMHLEAILAVRGDPRMTYAGPIVELLPCRYGDDTRCILKKQHRHVVHLMRHLSFLLSRDHDQFPGVIAFLKQHPQDAYIPPLFRHTDPMTMSVFRSAWITAVHRGGEHRSAFAGASAAFASPERARQRRRLGGDDSGGGGGPAGGGSGSGGSAS
jgi:hypothetical protein